MSLVYALDFQLERILKEGLEQRYARHAAMAERVQTWAEDHGLALYAPPGYRSKTVTTVINEKGGWEISNLNRFLIERGMRIANGYGVLKDKTFRIAHMGETTMADINVLLDAMEAYMKQAESR